MHCRGLLLLAGLLAFWVELPPSSAHGTPAARPGTCPVFQPADQLCGRFCSTDHSCPGEEKCCETKCGHECRRPSEAARGYCPRIKLPNDTATICLASCTRDENCRSLKQLPVQKCCSFGCMLKCMEAVEEHPGVCLKKPVLQTSVLCKDTCKDDRDCPLTQKCCFTGCSRGCLDTVRSERCQLPPQTGPCRGTYPRYYYNPAQKKCLKFVYGGCDGNTNNFKTQEECEKACGKISPEVCKLPKDSGPCLAYMPQYYYDRKSRTCKKFVYGGCQGNGNRFSSKTECMLVCGNRGKD